MRPSAPITPPPCVPFSGRSTRTGNDFSGSQHQGNAQLLTTDYGLRTTDYGLPTTDYGLRTTDYGLRTTDYGLRTTDYGLRTTDVTAVSRLRPGCAAPAPRAGSPARQFRCGVFARSPSAFFR